MTTIFAILTHYPEIKAYLVILLALYGIGSLVTLSALKELPWTSFLSSHNHRDYGWYIVLYEETDEINLIKTFIQIESSEADLNPGYRLHHDRG